MSDTFSRQERSRIMASIRSRGNRATELRFVQLLRTFKITGWRRGSKLPGRPDFVFYRWRLAVFIDGDFWHGNPRSFRLPKSNVEYWTQKIRGNRQRDKIVNLALEARGWKVIRFWQSSLHNGARAVARLSKVLTEQDRLLSMNPAPAGENTYAHSAQPELEVAEPKASQYTTQRKRGRSLASGNSAKRSVRGAPPVT
jgi:DNA mismatch endonuclease (patch repair protein)